MVDFAKRWDPLPVHVDEDLAEARPSSTKPDRGVVTVRLSLINDDDEVVMSHPDTFRR